MVYVVHRPTCNIVHRELADPLVAYALILKGVVTRQQLTRRFASIIMKLATLEFSLASMNIGL